MSGVRGHIAEFHETERADWWALCECGYESGPLDSHGDALADHDLHLARSASQEATNAAAFVFALYRLVRWDENIDDPEDMGLYQRSLAECRERWPWLDDAADQVDDATVDDAIDWERNQVPDGTDG